MSGEEWRGVEDWPYEVSSHGRVRRSTPGPGTYPGYVLAPVLNKRTNMLQGLMHDDGRRKAFRVHRLVAKAFIGPCPDGHEVNHIDGDRTNNHVENLEYVTRAENMRHAVRTGLIARGEKAARVRFTRRDVRKMRDMRRDGALLREIAEKFDTPTAQAWKIVTGQQWAHVPGAVT